MLTRWLNLLVLLTPLTFGWALIHGFTGTFCVHSYAQHSCGNNPHISYALLGAVSALLFAASLTTLKVLNRRR